MSNARSRVAVSRLPGDGAAGVSIASGTAVAAAVVTKSIEQPHTIVAGVPARFIKNRIQEPTP